MYSQKFSAIKINIFYRYGYFIRNMSFPAPRTGLAQRRFQESPDLDVEIGGCIQKEARRGRFVSFDRRSRLETCRDAAARFLLSDAKARRIIDGQIAEIRGGWDAVCEEAGMSAVDRAFLWERQFLNAYALEGYQAA